MMLLATFLLCGAQVVAFEKGDVIGEWLQSRTTNTAGLFFAARVSGMMEINRAFVIRSTGEAQVATFPQQGAVYEYDMRLSGEELRYLEILVRYAGLLDRSRGMITFNDSGNWECMVWWKGESKHVFWGPGQDARTDHLELFMSRVGYQAEVARRISAGISDTLIDRCLQPYRFAAGSGSRGDLLDVKRSIIAAPTWRDAKDGLEELAQSVPAEEWCGYVADYLMHATTEHREEAVQDIWRDGTVQWAGIPGRHRKRLPPVLVIAALNGETCR
jgi:hypothetical protein